jgi:hypothetical protein
MANELWDSLMKFYREIIEPRFDSLEARMVTKSDMLGYLDDIYARLDRLETEITRSAPQCGVSKSE